MTRDERLRSVVRRALDTAVDAADYCTAGLADNDSILARRTTDMTKSEQFAQEQMARLADMFEDMSEESCKGCSSEFANGRRHGLKLASDSLNRMHALFQQLLEAERLENEREDKIFRDQLAGMEDPRDKSN